MRDILVSGRIAYFLISSFALALAVGLLVVGVIRILRRSLFQERTFNRKIAAYILVGVLAYDAIVSCFGLSKFFFILWFFIHIPAQIVLVLSVALGVRQDEPYPLMAFITVIFACSVHYFGRDYAAFYFGPNCRPGRPYWVRLVPSAWSFPRAGGVPDPEIFDLNPYHTL